MTTVIVPVWALARVIDMGNFQDEGGAEGWTSPGMQKALDTLESALATIPADERFAYDDPDGAKVCARCGGRHKPLGEAR